MIGNSPSWENGPAGNRKNNTPLRKGRSLFNPREHQIPHPAAGFKSRATLGTTDDQDLPIRHRAEAGHRSMGPRVPQPVGIRLFMAAGTDTLFEQAHLICELIAFRSLEPNLVV